MPKTKQAAENFYAKVYALARQIPKGKVSTYGAIAERLGTKRAARLVGYALSQCVGTDVPAHRVVNRFGALTGKHHFPAPDLMKRLLLDEGVTFNPDETVKMELHFYDFSTPSRKKPSRKNRL